MNILLSDLTGASLLAIPIVLDDTKIMQKSKSATLETVDGFLNLAGNQELRVVAWSSIFPVAKSYIFSEKKMTVDGWLYVKFLETAMKFQVPIRVIVSDINNPYIFNMLVTVDSFNYNVDKSGDIAYTIKLTEFPAGIYAYQDMGKGALKYLKDFKPEAEAEKVLKKYGVL